jgi:hypothetical protein
VTVGCGIWRSGSKVSSKADGGKTTWDRAFSLWILKNIGFEAESLCSGMAHAIQASLALHGL